MACMINKTTYIRVKISAEIYQELGKLKISFMLGLV